MEIFLIKTFQLILCFAILILLHEGGHFFFAKLFGTRVEKFYLFFNPKFHLFSTYDTWFRRLLGRKPIEYETFTDENGEEQKRAIYDGTEYGIGWLPLGGYCSIAGMVDETMDAEQLKQPVKAWEFRAKPAWQRLLIMIGGVAVNFVLALFIYAMILFTWGDTYTPMRNITEGFKFSPEAQELGFRDGDILLAADGKTFDRFAGSVVRDLSTASSATVLRGGKEVNISLPGDLNLLDMLQSEPPFVAPLAASVVDSVVPGEGAAKAGLAAGDQIVGIEGEKLATWNEFDILLSDRQSALEEALKEKNAAAADSLRNLTVALKRAATERTDTLIVRLDEAGKLGIIKRTPFAGYKTVTREFTLLESFPAGIAHGWNVLCGYVSDLKYVFTADGAKSVGSFGTIGSLFPDTWDWLRFWELTAFISLMLAFMNLLPIPALDGGHVLFLLVEVVTRRKPSDKFMERAQTVGMIFLGALMLFAIFNDVVRFLF